MLSYSISSKCHVVRPLTLHQMTNFQTLPNWKHLQTTISNLMKIAESSQIRVENIVGKGEIAHYEQFLLFPQCFQKACTADKWKKGLVWERFKKKTSKTWWKPVLPLFLHCSLYVTLSGTYLVTWSRFYFTLIQAKRPLSNIGRNSCRSYNFALFLILWTKSITKNKRMNAWQKYKVRTGFEPETLCNKIQYRNHRAKENSLYHSC